MKKYKNIKKQEISKSILCVSLSLLIGFVSTYGLFFFSVDSYKYSSEKDTKTFLDIGYENFDVTKTDSITRYGKQSTPTSYEVNKLYSCLSNAEYNSVYKSTRKDPYYYPKTGERKNKYNPEWNKDFFKLKGGATWQ